MHPEGRIRREQARMQLVWKGGMLEAHTKLSVVPRREGGSEGGGWDDEDVRGGRGRTMKGR